MIVVFLQELDSSLDSYMNIMILEVVFIHVRRLEGAIRIVACAAPSIGGRPHMYEGTLHRYCRAKYR